MHNAASQQPQHMPFITSKLHSLANYTITVIRYAKIRVIPPYLLFLFTRTILLVLLYSLSNKIVGLSCATVMMTDDLAICAEHGDAILVVGTDEETIKIKVDTYILKAVSETFRALFSPSWRDGQGLSYDNPKEIEFPEDTPQAMWVICQILHHKYEVDSGLNPTDILQVAQQVDKYFLQRAMLPTSESWLRPEPAYNVLDLMNLLHAACLFENTRAKGDLMRELALNNPRRTFNYLIRQDAPPSLMQLQSVLQALQGHFRDRFHRLIFDIATYTTANGYNAECSCITAYSKQIYGPIRKNRLWPKSPWDVTGEDIGCMSIMECITKLEDIPQPLHQSGQTHVRAHKHVNCKLVPADLRDYIHKH